ncbi:aminoacyl-tRNA hydrolase [Thermoplasmatales archaeon ex4484_6]|nr:MAG: aminoacyl-tRNA hydrolase [Thermoplasmatales archaeon ex4484_6]RLF67399.1 MAG: peptidyl-tRNA hydrolase [Thermoplasmata archaeon]
MVVAIRTDIRLSPGKMAVQVAHAAVSCALSARKNNDRWFKAWFREGQKKVVVKGGNLKELYILKNSAEGLGLPTSIVQDAGLTEIEPGTVTCLGIGPGPSPEVDKVTGSLPLV